MSVWCWLILSEDTVVPAAVAWSLFSHQNMAKIAGCLWRQQKKERKKSSLANLSAARAHVIRLSRCCPVLYLLSECFLKKLTVLRLSQKGLSSFPLLWSFIQFSKQQPKKNFYRAQLFYLLQAVRLCSLIFKFCHRGPSVSHHSWGFRRPVIEQACRAVH